MRLTGNGLCRTWSRNREKATASASFWVTGPAAGAGLSLFFINRTSHPEESSLSRLVSVLSIPLHVHMVTLIQPADLRAEGDLRPSPCNWPWRVRPLTGFGATEAPLGGNAAAPWSARALIHHRHVPPPTGLHMSRHCGCPLPPIPQKRQRSEHRKHGQGTHPAPLDDCRSG